MFTSGKSEPLGRANHQGQRREATGAGIPPFAYNSTTSGGLCQILQLVKQAVARAYHNLQSGDPARTVKHLLIGIALADLALSRAGGVR